MSKSDVHCRRTPVTVLSSLVAAFGILVFACASPRRRPSFEPLEIEALPCAKGADLAVDEQGKPLLLSSEEVVKRVVHRTPVEAICCQSGQAKGIVKVELVIGSEGAVKCARAVDGHPLAFGQVLECISKWRFRPFMQKGHRRAVLGRMDVPYVFRY